MRLDWAQGQFCCRMEDLWLFTTATGLPFCNRTAPVPSPDASVVLGLEVLGLVSKEQCTANRF